jgi:hypothetical protein
MQVGEADAVPLIFALTAAKGTKQTSNIRPWRQEHSERSPLTLWLRFTTNRINDIDNVLLIKTGDE